MGLLLGVARGSAAPPQLIVLRHDPPGSPAHPVLGLVGKGVTFDTGGISLKPADGMERMKGDMASGAAVICAMRAAALLGAPIRVVGVVPTTENMPGGRAIKPGDVLRSASGKTVEVVNTDAEGRLILADALWYAQQLGATHLVDVATLTGACVTALGRITTGLFGRPGPWADHVRAVADRVSGEGILTAVESGRLAARAILEAAGDYTRAGLSSYEDLLDQRYGPPAPMRDRRRLLPSRAVSWAGAGLLRSRWFTRHVLLEGWFLHQGQLPLEDLGARAPASGPAPRPRAAHG